MQLTLFDTDSDSSPSLSYGRTSPESLMLTITPSDASSEHWWEQTPHSFRQEDSSGQIQVWLVDPAAPSRGALSTHNFSAWPSDGSACSLSHVLETRPIPRKYFLTPKAAMGIIRRAEKRGKDLPTMLLRALRAVAGESIGGGKAEDKTL